MNGISGSIRQEKRNHECTLYDKCIRPTGYRPPGERRECLVMCIPWCIASGKGGNIKVGFSSIFWNTAWTNKQAPHTLGIYCNPSHPALSLFPTEKYSDYQWWDIVSDCEAIVMDDFPAEYRPVVHLIDDWFTNRKLGLLFEAKVGNGKLMVCGAIC